MHTRSIVTPMNRDIIINQLTWLVRRQDFISLSCRESFRSCCAMFENEDRKDWSRDLSNMSEGRAIVQALSRRLITA